jgi:predicted Fe-S protein YdhL (DUF1289 family)
MKLTLHFHLLGIAILVQRKMCLGCFRSIDRILTGGSASSEDRSPIIERTIELPFHNYSQKWKE